MTSTNNNIDDLIFNMSLTELREMVRNSEPVSVTYKSHNLLADENDDFSELDERIFMITTSELKALKIENETVLNLNDSVALLTDLPQNQLEKGQVGTIIDVKSTNVFEVEFVNQTGQTLSFALVNAVDLLKLNYVLQPA